MKKFISLFLCLVMILSFFGVSCIATGDIPTISVSTDYAEVGETADIVIRLQNNPGIISMTLRVSYDASVFTLTSVRDGGILGAQSHKPEYTSPYTLTWANDASTTNFTDDGTLVRLKFEVGESAIHGEEYPITVSYDLENYDIYNKDVECVDFAVTNGSIIIDKGDTQPLVTPISDFDYDIKHGEVYITGYHGDDTELLIADTYVINGKERSVVAIEVSAFEGNEEITSVILPSTLKSIGDYAFYDCTALTDVVLWSKNATIGEQAFGYYYVSIGQDKKVENFNLTAYQGSFAEEYLFDNELSFTAQTKPLGKGDVNADGEYSAKDLVAISDYIIGKVSFNEDIFAVADLNDDDTINILDLVCLKKFLMIL